MTTAAGAARLLGAGATALGVVMATRPHATTSAVGGPESRAPDDRIVRVLGTRQAVQGLLTAAGPSPAVLILGAVVDLTHAATMVPVALARREYRRVALTSAATAVLSAAAAFALGQRSLHVRGVSPVSRR